jgi:L-lactate utilization protein LutB
MHIALMGVERLVPELEDLSPMLALLPRSATGQKLTSYVHLIQGPRRETDPDGPEERHLILIDNGRFALAQSWLSEALYCIRCGACTDACPVYREVGGHAYESVYSGPIGSVVSAGLFGMKDYGHLAKASSLCGACLEVCPVGIDIPSLLLRVRSDYSKQIIQPSVPHWGMRVYAWLTNSPKRFRWAQRIASLGTKLLPKHQGWGRWLPATASAWTGSRDFPPFAKVPFRDQFNKINQTIGHAPIRDRSAEHTISIPTPQVDVVDQFEQELHRLKGTFIRCSEDQVADLIAEKLHELGDQRVLCRMDDHSLTTIITRLRDEGVIIVEPHLRDGVDRETQHKHWGELEIGLTGSSAGIAETGTLVLSTSDSQIASLLPKTHIAVLSSDQIYAGFGEWARAGGKETLLQSQSVSLISGPSRTADIEMTLTLGVHGPGQVIVYCVD